MRRQTPPAGHGVQPSSRRCDRRSGKLTRTDDRGYDRDAGTLRCLAPSLTRRRGST
ncbi:hypothetical protein PACID_00040 [Acidipropionibacterium acidipropionici ATCC 4875]|uniref:Uncharacterized protein n=1 Tax=Acidipropionibacterium acidipropionici (strain ATCC 4875 / DSM 20272 / JCM 6432 / NBRC 12425 / NCIMB 8070 / 4) TaxID=1171373 RepID=K7S018_ACIA4|nr:hypothetical protein PACID_00040 [Acidipropionibacterium acidipropionici ATCC 4875]